MMTLSRFLTVPFDDPQISLAELLAFTIDHLQRMIANNAGGEFTARIAATGAALDLLQDSASDDMTKLAIREARNQAKDAFRKGLAASIAKLHGGVVTHFGPATPELTECFPEGRSIFGECRDDKLELHLTTLVNGLTAYQSAMGGAGGLGGLLLGQAGTLRTTWVALYGASGTATGAVTTTQAGKKAARENLQLMLFLNLLTIAMLFPRQPEKLDLYMQQSLLENDESPPEPEPPAPPPP